MRLQPQIKIRRAAPEDAEAIAAVLHEAFVEFKALYTEGGLAATTPAAEHILVRMTEGRFGLPCAKA